MYSFLSGLHNLVPSSFFFIAYPDHFPGRTWGLEGTISSEAKTMPTQSHSYQKSVLGCQLWVVLQPFRAPFYQILPSSVIIKRRQSKEKTEPAFYPLVCPCVLIVSRKNSIWRRGLKRSFPFFFLCKGVKHKRLLHQSVSIFRRPMRKTHAFASDPGLCVQRMKNGDPSLLSWGDRRDPRDLSSGEVRFRQWKYR